MKSKERTITLQAIRAYVGEKSFSRGESYARNGHVSNLRQAGATVKADCQGSEMEPYRVVVEIADGEIVLVERHANAPNNLRLDEWLYGYYVKQKNWPAALERALHRFRAWPNLDSYQRVRQVAGKQDAWDALRPELIREVERKGNHALLTEISLDEGDIDAALRAFTKAQQTRSLRWGFDQPDELTIRVAQAAASTYPREARKIYLDEAERLVTLRGRVAYQEACALLKRVQEIDKTLGETEAWHAFLSDFQMRHKRLRALQEEMHAAKLI